MTHCNPAPPNPPLSETGLAICIDWRISIVVFLVVISYILYLKNSDKSTETEEIDG